MLDSEPLPSASEPCCPTHLQWEMIGNSDKCQWSHKKCGPTEIRTRSYSLRNFCPNPTAEFYFWQKVGKNRLKKKKNDRTEWIPFTTYSKICGEKWKVMKVHVAAAGKDQIIQSGVITKIIVSRSLLDDMGASREIFEPLVSWTFPKWRSNRCVCWVKGAVKKYGYLTFSFTCR